MTSIRTPLLLLCLLLSTAHAEEQEDKTSICNAAATKLASVIEDWHQFIVDAKAEAKNASTLNLYAEFQAGELPSNVARHCTENWYRYKDIYLCFSGIMSDLGAAICLHPDTNKNNWTY